MHERGSLLLPFGIFAIPSAFGQEAEGDALSIERAYMAAYSATDWDAMASFMGDDFLLVDRTNPDPDFVGGAPNRSPP